MIHRGAVGHLVMDEQHQLLQQRASRQPTGVPPGLEAALGPIRSSRRVCVRRLIPALRRRARPRTTSAARDQASTTTPPKGPGPRIASSPRAMANAILVRNGAWRARHAGSWSNPGATC
jgi:hypothetical protein